MPYVDNRYVDAKDFLTYYWGTPLEKQTIELQFHLLTCDKCDEEWVKERVIKLYREFIRVNPNWWNK